MLPNALLRTDPRGDLDDRIAAAEQRLIARQRRLRGRVDGLMQRGRGMMSPGRMARLAVGALATATSVWLLLRSGRKRRHADRPPEAASSSRPAFESASHAGAWLHLLPSLWPALPARWRARVNPHVRTAVFGIALPMLEAHLARRAAPPVLTMERVDLERYAGLWHEIARLPTPYEQACAGQPSARYTAQPDGTFVVLNSCPLADGKERVATGVARVRADSGGSKLEVTFLPALLRWLPIGWADYWILYVDAQYSVALVGTSDRQGLWVLAREPRIAMTVLQAVIDIAEERGYAVERMKISQPR